MKLLAYDPHPRHEYCTHMYLGPIKSYAWNNGIECVEVNDIHAARDGILITLSDNLPAETCVVIKNNNCRIVGINIIDSAWISQKCTRPDLVDLMLMVSGVQRVNYGYSFKVDDNLRCYVEKKPFMPEPAWEIFDAMRRAGRLQSLPYVHWTRQPDIPPQPYNQRSQKVLIRGGLHVRRFLVALFLMRYDLLDPNSGMMTRDYFRDDMNPQFRYCDDCRQNFNGYWKYSPNPQRGQCNSPAPWPAHVGTLAWWNNRCPKSFYWLAEQFERRYGYIDKKQLTDLCNGAWLSQEDHLRMAARITFTTDLKWLFSIYAPQRFWDAAMVGCLNVLPMRTLAQEYFPVMQPNEHYLVYDEADLDGVGSSFTIEEKGYNEIAGNARALYDQWLRPTGNYSVSENLLRHIFGLIERHAT